AYYLSAEYLVGRLIYNDLMNAGIAGEISALLREKGRDLAEFEDIEAASLGNGGLGRLSACFLDSAAARSLPLDGYGLRYRFGLFRQRIENGEQKEEADDWLREGDPWSVRRSGDTVTVFFADQTVKAVPYDMPVVGWRSEHICTLRLWQCEPISELDFEAFDRQDTFGAVREKTLAENITRVLYPNDASYEGKRLRLKQQYFLCSASLQDIIARMKRAGVPLSDFAAVNTLQLNDTHPVLAVPELMRLLMREGMSFDEAFVAAKNSFNYTNHTVMAEALERWDLGLLRSVCPETVDIIQRIDERAGRETGRTRGTEIIENGVVHMARLAVYMAVKVNGVAEIHSGLIRRELFAQWYALSPDKFTNVTNGVTQRRWLGVCDPELTALLEEKTGGGFMTEPTRLEGLRERIDDETTERFNAVKRIKKEQLSAWLRRREGMELPADFIFDMQIKRIHEYKRQLLNALVIADLYFSVKDGSISDLPPTAFIFAGKAASSYRRAKSVIKYINRLAALINSDPEARRVMRVIFVPDYNCSAAERLIPAADISEQISPAGTEASGTGNMKLMLNGAVTLGTPDGANIEIARAAGYENNYIFGADVEKLRSAAAGYDPRRIYEEDRRINRAVNSIVDYTVPTDGEQKELFDSLLYGVDGQRADVYYLLLDFEQYRDTRLRALYDWRDRLSFGRKALLNVSAAGVFSSDRSVGTYAENIWKITPCSADDAPLGT
ncbi:MAG: glycogen/starch/alpha-glucan phosphorylase, partial [Oscillospiraceae bacterium]|nr:glycogen/starch/alpha-glucan phosphorylase [Oscillospiraceae bacterium]